jgi:putative restriction endonuclease
MDACHIEPFATSHDDTITNGIYLCPTLHRAFDRHLISIDENYRLIISKAFIERSDSPYSIKQFEGKVILLPADRNHYPSQEKLQKHREMLVC